MKNINRFVNRVKKNFCFFVCLFVCLLGDHLTIIMLSMTIDDDNHRGYRVLTDFTCSDYLSFISSSVFFLKKFSEKFVKKFKEKH